MTDNEIRIAIFEACGWTTRSGVVEYDGVSMPWALWIKDGKEYNPHDAPDYPNDLNAMHEAEKVLSGENAISYRNHLARITTVLRNLSDMEEVEPYCNENECAYIHATAKQRAEAFLKTIEKWKD